MNKSVTSRLQSRIAKRKKIITMIHEGLPFACLKFIPLQQMVEDQKLDKAALREIYFYQSVLNSEFN